MEIEKKEYGTYVKEVTPVHSTVKNMLRAFLAGGAICAAGQACLGFYGSMGMEKATAAAWTTLTLIAASVVLTGLNLYQRIVKFAGAGALVPITGFANSVAAAAIEYRSEGHVFGIGCKIFTIAGPVILYGIFASWALGLAYWIGGAMGILPL
ncbi:MAG: SpoVA/SpoVAEb family sporulation membrane protein [Sakamotonia sp.]|jgi:stage V sporulation protein AC